MKTKILKTLCLAAIIICGIGCTKETDLTESRSQENVTLDAETAKSEFARILSKAVAENSELRAFIKSTAEQRFDKDYDVFYPFVKDVEVSEGVTFRDILLDYSDTPCLLENIEQRLPLLNILVPDWEWLGCFSINNWDTSDNAIAVGYDTDTTEKPIYADGKVIGKLKDWQLPGFPTIIVKCNERMRVVSTATKSSDIQYDFIDPEFDGSLETKAVEHRYSTVTIDGVPDVTPFMKTADLNSYVIGAYNEFKNDNYTAQRDYIYYGMTKANTTGQLNVRITEVIRKIKLNVSVNNASLNESEDFHKAGQKLDYKKNDGWKSAEQLRNHFYSDGEVEFRFYATVAYPDGSSTTTMSKKSLSFGDLFAISHADLDFRHKTWFCKDWFVYTINDSYIYPKWCDINLTLPKWDIGTQAAQMKITVEEYDSGKTTNREYNESFKYMTNFSANAELGYSGDKLNFKVGLGTGTSKEVSHSSRITISSTDNSDEWGTGMLYYMNPVIKEKTTHNGVSGYLVNTFSLGDIEMIIIPTYM